MQVSAIAGSGADTTPFGRGHNDPEPPPSAERPGLPVPIRTPAERSSRPVQAHPYGPFIAHLIAAREQVEQTRAKRRAGVGEAIERYLTEPEPARRAHLILSA